MKSYFSFLALLMLVLVSCKKDEPNPDGDYSNGVFILNEGLFQSGNSSVSFYNNSTGQVEEDIFQKSAGRPLGDVLQSMTIINGLAYLVVNHSAKIEVVNANDFSPVTTIAGFSSPRYILPISSTTAYVTDWISNRVKILDLRTHTITGSIPVGEGPEQMLLHDGKVYVTNSGGFGIDSSLSVIDVSTGFVVDEFPVPGGPVAIGLDADSRIWVLCRGDYRDYNDLNDDIAGSLVRIDLEERSLDRQFVFQPWNHPMKMEFSPDKTQIWYLNEGLFKVGIHDLSAPSTAFSDKYFYGLGVNPENGEVYCSDPVDYVQKGFAFRFNPQGALIDSFRVEYVPNGFVFR